MNTTLLRDIDFGPIWGMSGVQNFFGEGYSYHKWLRLLFRTSFDGVTFVSKTTTLNARLGNMPLDDKLQPKELIPSCIYVDIINGIVLNAVSLSGPGIINLLDRGDWQKRTKPFFISFMSVAESPEDVLSEVELFVGIMQRRASKFKTKFGIQLNLSCPNTGHDIDNQSDSPLRQLDILSGLTKIGIAVSAKISVEMPVAMAKKISDHPCCDAICLSNTVGFGKLPDQIDWKKYFPDGVSPLTKRGFKQPGGLSGKLLRRLVENYLSELKRVGVTKPINAGGGILRPRDVTSLFERGASSASIGSIVILRPWGVNAVVRRAHRINH